MQITCWAIGNTAFEKADPPQHIRCVQFRPGANLLTIMKQSTWYTLIFRRRLASSPHHRLQHKLKAYRFGGNVLNWIKPFLTDRKLWVVVAGVSSQWMDINSGTPQGTVLGPVFFLTYIDDIRDNLQCPFYFFADDMKLFSRNTQSAGTNDLQDDMDLISEWTHQWLIRVRLNLDKCKLLTIHITS